MSSDLRPNSPISDNIHWIKDRFVNAYIIDNSDSVILIDTAINKKAVAIQKYLTSELENKPIKTIYLTHHHSDHMGGLHYLNDHHHPVVYSSEKDAEVITGKRKPPKPNSFILKILYPVLSPMFTAKPISSTNFLNDQQVIDDFKIYHLPGHTMGSMGFLKENVFFAGDSCRINDKKQEVFIGAKLFTESMEEAYKSLERVSTLDFDILFTGHGTPILQDAKMRVLDAVEKLNKD